MLRSMQTAFCEWAGCCLVSSAGHPICSGSASAAQRVQVASARGTEAAVRHQVSPQPVHKAGKLSWCWDL